jgi:hypothetical protein
MSRFVITITPDYATVDGADNAFTTVRVDTSTGQARITELTVRAANDGGLSPTDLPPIDLGLLIRALTVTGQAQALPPAPLVATPTPAADHVAEPSGPEPTAAAPVPAESPGATRRRRGRKAAAATSPVKKAAASTSVARNAAAKKATTAKKAITAKKAGAAKSTAKATSRRGPAAATTAPRAYRRMPEPEQVMDAYRQTGSIIGVAEHFGVPRHTVAGWARRLRTQGHTIGRQ